MGLIEALLAENEATICDFGATIGAIGATIADFGATIGAIGATIANFGATIGAIGATIADFGATISAIGATICEIELRVIVDVAAIFARAAMMWAMCVAQAGTAA